MKRRSFLKSTAATAGLAGVASSAFLSAAESGDKTSRQFYELRLYHFRRGPMTKRFEDYVRSAAMPAMKRLGTGPVGIFDVVAGPDNPTAYVLIPYESLDQFSTLGDRLAADGEYLKQGAEFINAPPTDPPYVRVESSLMKAFEGMPRLEVPTGEPRLFELRTYESHSKRAHLKKVEMFNRGEIEIFRRAGMAPVFFGQTLVGTRLPNLTYMLAFKDGAAREECWRAFGEDPEWRKLRSMPEYADSEIVSNISNVMLRPTASSQI